VALADGLQPSKAGSIVVSGTDVYVAGWEEAGQVLVAKYWKNGLPVALSDGVHGAEAYAIAVSGSEVYVAGAQKNGPADAAMYWKFGVPVSLTAGTTAAVAAALAVDGSDLGGRSLRRTGIHRDKLLHVVRDVDEDRGWTDGARVPPSHGRDLITSWRQPLDEQL
jgi:hypothetical protein